MPELTSGEKQVHPVSLPHKEVIDSAPQIDEDDEYLDACRSLRHGLPRIRVRSVARLLEFGSRAIPQLARALGDEEPEVRHAAAEALGKIGTCEVFEPLCAALNSKDVSTRAAAATALGASGDKRAVPVLTAMLGACFVRGSARFQRWLGLIVMPSLMLLITYWLLSPFQRPLRWCFLAIWLSVIIWNSYVTGRRTLFSPVCGAICKALASLAEVHPDPEIGRMLPHFRSIAGDVFLQERDTRVSARDAVARIESLLTVRGTLPRPSSTQTENASELPRVFPDDERSSTSSSSWHTTR